jgi:hypothetical protein
MSRVEAAAGMDRLPWLPDEPQQRPAERRRNAVLPWAAATIVVTAAGGLWLGTRSIDQQPATTTRAPGPATTVRLPEPRPAAHDVRLPAEREVSPLAAPQVRPAPAPDLRIVLPAEKSSAAKKKVDGATTAKELEKAPAVVAPPAQFAGPKPWNPRVFAGAAGRLVQIGAFGSVTQSKRGWWYMVRSYPAVAQLPAVVRQARNSKGRIFYRFQVGTTSQAHSEVLCQRMERIRFSCAVIGLPWKAKVER